MKFETLVKIISEIPGGQFFRLRYMSKMPVKSQYEKEGISVVKLVSITTRTGIRYSALPGVEYKATMPPDQEAKESNWSWVVKNRIKFNRNTNKYYFVIAPTKKGCNTKCDYMLSTKEGNRLVSKEEIQNYIIDSYWNKEPNRLINTISLDNILSIH